MFNEYSHTQAPINIIKYLKTFRDTIVYKIQDKILHYSVYLNCTSVCGKGKRVKISIISLFYKFPNAYHSIGSSLNKKWPEQLLL